MAIGVPGERLPEEKSKVLLALDGTEAGDKAFNYLLTNKTIAQGSHIFLTTVLPANVLGGPWVSGPLSIDTKKQNELLRQLRVQAVERMAPYKAQLKDKGFNVTMHVLHGDARASLLKVINYHKVDMVLMYVMICWSLSILTIYSGKRNLGWKRGLTSGTVSSYLVSHSPVPVLVIK